MRPVTVHVSAPVVVQVFPPGVLDTVYPVIGLPPSVAGGVQVTFAFASPATAATFVGAPGSTGSGMAEFEDTDVGPVPTALVAFTLNLYAIPSRSPLTLHTFVAVPVAVQVLSVGVLETVYFVIEIPPGVGVGAVHLTVTLSTPGSAVGVPGALGSVAGTT